MNRNPRHVIVGMLFFALSVVACHKSSMGLRGMAGLGESMTSRTTSSAATFTLPTEVVDAHVQLESAGDRFALQPGSGMEVAFRGSNISGAAVMAQNMDFYPNWEHPTPFNLVYCARGAEVVRLPKVERLIREGKYHCLLFDARSTELSADAGEMIRWYRLAKRYGLAVVFHHPHLEGGMPGRYWKAPAIERVAKDFPDLSFVVAQPGMPDVARLYGVMERRKNLYLVTSTVVNKPIHLMGQTEFETELKGRILGMAQVADQLMFGSAWPYSRIAPLVELLAEALPPAKANAVFAGNAKKVFGIRPHRGVAAAAAAAAAEAEAERVQ